MIELKVFESMAKKEFYETQDKEQLVISLLNAKEKNELLSEKLYALTGCSIYGTCDGTIGCCIECYHNNPALHNKCSQFQDEFRKRK